MTSAKTLLKKWQKEAEKLPLETKQKFWRAMLDGKSVREARQIAGIEDLNVAAELFCMCHRTIYVPKGIEEIK